MGKRHVCPGCGAEFDCETGTAQFPPGDPGEPDPDEPEDEPEDEPDDPPAPPELAARPNRFRRNGRP